MPWNEVMEKWKAGKLKSGSTGKTVKKQKQAVAIMLSEKRKAKAGKKEYQAKSGQTSKRRGNQHFESETHAYNFRDHL